MISRVRLLLVALAFLIGIVAHWQGAAMAGKAPKDAAFTGTQSCRECHEKFYRLWAPSHHGKAMQPFSPALAKGKLTPPKKEINIQGKRYHAQFSAEGGWVRESGPNGVKKYPITWLVGGKNVFYFLTPMAKGRLQTLPVAYDLNKREWFDTAKSGVRHMGGQGDDPVPWTHRAYTFNTSCRGCHVSQFSSSYDLATGTYHTTWREPGINCETCHGPGEAHIKVCKEAPKGKVPKDLKLTRGGRDFTVQQNNAVCSACHAKMSPITPGFNPGGRFFDHYDLVTLEHPDYYPDGRDLGENYTFTSWRMSPCAKSGKLSCLHCHTSSGRFRHKKNPNQACAPCHSQRVKHAAAHIKHRPGDKSPTCVSCHMPMTGFARMNRSDHSMLPPAPAATIKFKGPNACNLCHKDKSAAWADQKVRKWRKRDYQGKILRWGGLIAAARQRDFSRLDEMLAYIGSKDRDEIVTNSLVRLLGFCPDAKKWPSLRMALKDPSPLIRGSAADVLGGDIASTDTMVALFKALKDPIRLVRIRAAASLAPLSPRLVKDESRKDLENATKELVSSYTARADDPASHYNLGNFHLNRGNHPRAIRAYTLASRLGPDLIPPLVNAAMAYNYLGDKREAEQSLRKALELDPKNPAANFNLGLLLAGEGRLTEAKTSLNRALKADPKNAAAAYNLGVITARENPQVAIKLLTLAARLRPDRPQYGYTLAFFEYQGKNPARAARVLQGVLARHPAHGDSYLLLAEVRLAQGKNAQAESLLLAALKSRLLSQRDNFRVAARLKALRSEAKP